MKTRVAASLTLTIAVCQGLETLAKTNHQIQDVGRMACEVAEALSTPACTAISGLDPKSREEVLMKVAPYAQCIDPKNDVPWMDYLGLIVAQTADLLRMPALNHDTRLAMGAVMGHLRWLHWNMAGRPEYMARDPTIAKQWECLLN